jgi:hypothetical protein
MSSITHLIIALIGFYLVLIYLFLFPSLPLFLSQPHPADKKTLHVLAFMISPVAIPLGGVLVIGWWALVACFTLIAVLVIFPFYWLNSHMEFGKLFEAWFNLAARLVGWIREKMEIFLGLSSFPQNHPENNLTHPINSPIQ